MEFAPALADRARSPGARRAAWTAVGVFSILAFAGIIAEVVSAVTTPGRDTHASGNAVEGLIGLVLLFASLRYHWLFLRGVLALAYAAAFGLSIYDIVHAGPSRFAAESGAGAYLSALLAGVLLVATAILWAQPSEDRPRLSDDYWRLLGAAGMSRARFHSLPGWQQRAAKMALGGAVAFLLVVLVNVLERAFGQGSGVSLVSFDGAAYIAFVVVAALVVPEWKAFPAVPLPRGRKPIGRAVVPLGALALAITFPYYTGHMFTIPVFGEFPSVETAVVMVVFIMMAVGLNIVVGYAGLLDLGYVAFYAMGAYSVAWLASTQFAGAKCPKAGFGIDNCPVATVPKIDFSFGAVGITKGLGGIHVSIWLLLALAGILTAFIGVVIGLPTLRLRGDYLAIVTLGFGEIMPQIARNGNDLGGFNLTGGPQGITPVDTPGFGNTLSNWTGGFLPANYLTNAQSARVFYWTALVLLLFTVFCSIRLRDSRLGRAWIAIREDEIAASAMGVPLMRTKTWAYACGAFFGGVAGAYFAAFKSSTFPQDFYFNISVFILCMVILGGMGNVWGVILGAAFLSYLNFEGLANTGAWLNLHFGTHVDVPEYASGIYGVIIVFVMLLRPQGLLPSARRKRELELGTHDEPAYDVTH